MKLQRRTVLELRLLVGALIAVATLWPLALFLAAGGDHQWHQQSAGHNYMMAHRPATRKLQQNLQDQSSRPQQQQQQLSQTSYGGAAGNSEKTELFPAATVPPQHKPEPPGLKMAWLMSFPNSGTSFTSRLVRDATKTDSASNYADETLSGQNGVRLPVFDDQPEGPFWIKPEDSPEFTEPSQYILTKVCALLQDCFYEGCSVSQGVPISQCLGCDDTNCLLLLVLQK